MFSLSFYIFLSYLVVRSDFYTQDYYVSLSDISESTKEVYVYLFFLRLSIFFSWLRLSTLDVIGNNKRDVWFVLGTKT